LKALVWLVKAHRIACAILLFLKRGTAGFGTFICAFPCYPNVWAAATALCIACTVGHMAFQIRHF
jgi:hypothetical protein